LVLSNVRHTYPPMMPRPKQLSAPKKVMASTVAA
jgi:hypothetical protein